MDPDGLSYDLETSEMSKVILNEGSAESSSSSDNVDSALQKAMTGLKAKYMSEDGSKVDYKGMASSEEFKIYQTTARMLQLTDPANFSLDKKKAFFINIYNSLTMHAMVYQASMGKLPDSPKNVDKFWAIHCYNIGGQILTLDEIEHGALRDNQGHPAAKKNQFESDDPRFQFVCSPLDPRIHFALNCGARSCPPIRVYTELKMNRQLDIATVSFLSQEVNISAPSRTVTLSKLLLWYKGDFIREDISEEDEDVKLLGWLVGKVGEEKQEAIKTAREEKYKVVFKDYNWDSNEI